MSTLLNIIDQSTQGSLWLVCRPITRTPPEDISGLTEIAQEYWTGKLLVHQNSQTYTVSNWFSIFYEDIRRSVGSNITDEVAINLSKLDTDTDLRSNLHPTLSIGRSTEYIRSQWIDS